MNLIKLNEWIELNVSPNVNISNMVCEFIQFLLWYSFSGDEISTVKPLKDELESCDFKVWDIFLGHTGVQVKFFNA